MNDIHTSPPIADDLFLADPSRWLKKLVIKLRWVGMEEEARRLQRSLCPAWLADGASARRAETHATLPVFSNAVMKKNGAASTHAAVALLSVAVLACADPAKAQSAAPDLSGTYRCAPQPSSCQWSGQSFTVAQSGTRLDIKNNKGEVGQGLLSSNITLSVGAPWNMLGVIEPDSHIQWSNGTVWRKP
jgi:hypothetical protein